MFNFRRRMCVFAIFVVALAALSTGCTTEQNTGREYSEQTEPADIAYPQQAGGGEYETHWAGFTSKSEGWFIGSPGVALGSSENYVYLTHDGGKTWKETGNVNDEWARVLNCGGFSDENVGYLCFRYDIESTWAEGTS